MSQLVHVGFHKTASTWLQRRVFPLAAGACSTAGDNVMAELLRHLAFDDVFYADVFRATLREFGPHSIVSSEALVGMPWGPSNPDRTADRLKAVMPQAKVLIVTRNEDDLKRSLFANYIQDGGILPFARFDEILNPGYLNAMITVERFESRFDRVHVLDYRLIASRPEEALVRISEFADIDLTLPTDDAREHVSLKGWRLELLRRWNRVFRVSVHNPSPPLPLPYAGAMRQVLQTGGHFRRHGSPLSASGW